MAGRPKGSGAGVRMSDAHRLKIKVSNIINALQKHVDGTKDMGATQVQAAQILLKKALPDLQPVDGDTGSAAINLKITMGGDADS